MIQALDAITSLIWALFAVAIAIFIIWHRKELWRLGLLKLKLGPIETTFARNTQDLVQSSGATAPEIQEEPDPELIQNVSWDPRTAIIQAWERVEMGGKAGRFSEGR